MIFFKIIIIIIFNLRYLAVLQRKPFLMAPSCEKVKEPVFAELPPYGASPEQGFGCYSICTSIWKAKRFWKLRLLRWRGMMLAVQQSQPAVPARSAGSLQTADAGRTMGQMITRFPPQQMTLQKAPAFCIGDSTLTPAEPAVGALRPLNCRHSSQASFSQINDPSSGAKEMGRKGRDEMRSRFCCRF